MSKFSKANFPQARIDQMGKVASEFNPFNVSTRVDSMTPKAFELLQTIDPILAYKIQAGTFRPGMHKDASESLFFARQLEYIRPGLLEVLYPDLEAKNFIPTETSIPPGAEQYTYRSVNKVGRAQLIKQYSDDPPRVDVLGNETTQQIRGMADMYGYTMQELRAAMMAQIPLDVRKAMAARYSIALLSDEVFFYGNADKTAAQSATGNDAGALEGGLKGIASLAGTQAFTTPTGIGGSVLWRLKTPDEVVYDMQSCVDTAVTASLGVYRPDTMLLPLAAYNIAATRRMGDGSNQTILDFFLKTSPYVDNVFPTYRLDAARSSNWNGTGSATTGRMIAYERNPDRLAALLPLEFEQLAPQQEHFEIRTSCHGRIGGVIAYHPGSIVYGDGITDTTDR